MADVYYIKIYANGITHKQDITTPEDLEILKVVLSKVLKDAEEYIKPKPATDLNTQTAQVK